MIRKSTQTTSKGKALSKTSKLKKRPAKVEQSSQKTASVARDADASDKKSDLVAFSMGDVEALVATRISDREVEAPKGKSLPKKKKVSAEKKTQAQEKPVEKRVLGAASLADILGYNPAEKKASTSLEEDSVPKKWKKYYKLLIELREHLSEEISLHTSNTLQHRVDDHAGDQKLEDDAGTDAFDRDFALSLVSGEQEALNEIEEALLRIKKGTYGVCEVTGKAISKERLTAVPFARFSVEGQIEFEKNSHRKIDRSTGGLFADGNESPKIASDDDDD